MRGEIESRYVSGATDLSLRLQALDAGVDPDGRFRIGEFFCFDNTWRPALRALVARERVLLMDLRGFTKANAGRVFELEQLSPVRPAAACSSWIRPPTAHWWRPASPFAPEQPAWVMMKREAAAMPDLWRE